jgi:hypothetical protein
VTRDSETENEGQHTSIGVCASQAKLRNQGHHFLTSRKETSVLF